MHRINLNLDWLLDGREPAPALATATPDWVVAAPEGVEAAWQRLSRELQAWDYGELTWLCRYLTGLAGESDDASPCDLDEPADAIGPSHQRREAAVDLGLRWLQRTLDEDLLDLRWMGVEVAENDLAGRPFDRKLVAFLQRGRSHLNASGALVHHERLRSDDARLAHASSDDCGVSLLEAFLADPLADPDLSCVALAAPLDFEGTYDAPTLIGAPDFWEN